MRRVSAGVAAAKLTGYLKPALCLVHACGDATAIQRDARMRADPQGNILITDAFWRVPVEKRTDTAPPLLVYAELLAPATHARSKLPN